MDIKNDTTEIWTFNTSNNRWIYQHRNESKTEYFLDEYGYPNKVVTTIYEAGLKLINNGTSSDEKIISEIDTTY